MASPTAGKKKVVKKKTTKRKGTKGPAVRNRLLTAEQAGERGILEGNGAVDHEGIGEVSEQGAVVPFGGPYVVDVTIEGIKPLLIHGYNVDLIEWLDTLPKGAQEKKRDYPELVCYWDKPFIPVKNGKPPFKKAPRAILCGATDWIHRAMVEAGKRFSDPSSSGGRKSAKELVEAGVEVIGETGDIDVTPFWVAPRVGSTTSKEKYKKASTWDCLDKRRVTVGTAAVPRVRPMMMPGWRLKYVITVTEPSFIPVTGENTKGPSLRSLIEAAGARQGLGDYRPKFGKFCIVEWEVRDDD